MTGSWIEVEGTIVEGHGVASGRAGDPRFPGGTIRLQLPHFLAAGLELSKFHPATLNVSIAPKRYEPRRPARTIRNLTWLAGYPREDFSFFHCRIARPGSPAVDGLVYRPHPETKPEFFQDESVLEILAPWIEGLTPGDRVALALPANEIAILPAQRAVERRNARARPAEILRLLWELRFRSAPWPRRIEVEPRRPPGERVFGDTIAVTFVGHSTALIQVEGINILTDPVFSERASPVTWAGPRRVRAPGVALRDLPVIDIILLSHNHYDHLDTASLRALQEKNGRPAPLILTGAGNGRLLRRRGLTCFREMKWGDSSSFGGCEIVFAESRHGSGRWLLDQGRALWGAFVIRTGGGRRIYFAGDTAYGPHFREAAETHGPFDLSLLPIGACEPRWFMERFHLDPDEAVRAHLDLGSKRSIAIHFGTFRLTAEGIDEPARALGAALAERGLGAGDFAVPGTGETIEIRRGDAPQA